MPKKTSTRKLKQKIGLRGHHTKVWVEAAEALKGTVINIHAEIPAFRKFGITIQEAIDAAMDRLPHVIANFDSAKSKTGSVRQLACKAAQNALLTLLKKHKKHGIQQEIDTINDSPVNRPDRIAMRSEIKPAIERAIDRLIKNESDRAIVRRYLELKVQGKSEYTKILTKEFGKTPNAIRVIVHRAMEKLRQDKTLKELR